MSPLDTRTAFVIRTIANLMSDEDCPDLNSPLADTQKKVKSLMLAMTVRISNAYTHKVCWKGADYRLSGRSSAYSCPR